MSIEMLKDLLDWYASNDYLDLFEALKPDLERVKLVPYHYDEPALPVYSKDAYFKSSMKFLDVTYLNRFFAHDRPIQTKVHDIPPAKYEPGALVKNSLVSGGCRVAGTVENSILGRSVTVEAGAVIKNAIVQQSCIIKAGAQLENVIVDKNNIIEENCVYKGTPEEILIKVKSPWQW